MMSGLNSMANITPPKTIVKFEPPRSGHFYVRCPRIAVPAGNERPQAPCSTLGDPVVSKGGCGAKPVSKRHSTSRMGWFEASWTLGKPPDSTYF